MLHVTTSEMSWIGIAQAVILPAVVSVLMALPFWLRATPMTGTIIGAGAIFVFAVAFVGREYVVLERFNQHCRALLEIHVVCRPPHPVRDGYAVDRNTRVVTHFGNHVPHRQRRENEEAG
jgi:hypothetical protein